MVSFDLAGRYFIQRKKFLPSHTLAVLKNNRKWVWGFFALFCFVLTSPSPISLHTFSDFLLCNNPQKIHTILWIRGRGVWLRLVPFGSVQMPLCWVARPDGRWWKNKAGIILPARSCLFVWTDALQNDIKNVRKPGPSDLAHGDIS